MSAADIEAKNFLYKWISPLLLAALIYLALKKYGRVLQDRFFVSFWSRAMIEYHAALKEMKKTHFNSMNHHKSADSDLRNRGLIRILEIGAGSGANFEFYPANSQLTVVEPNAFFEPLFYQNQSKHPDIKMEKFVLASAEDMKGVEDGSVDIVVSTLVLCSVRSLEKTLQEVHRILAPGGKFYYWEHVHDVKGTWLHLIQDVLSFKLWDLLFGCYLNRSIDHVIQSSQIFSSVEQKRFDIPLRNGVWKLIKVHVMGVATK